MIKVAVVRNLSKLVFLLSCSVSMMDVAQAAVIRYSVEGVGFGAAGNPVLRFTYDIRDLTLSSFQELDIEFDPELVTKLQNPVAGPEFDVLLLQPNNPPGVAGDFSLLALVDNPFVSGMTISVDAVMAGLEVPKSQTFTINEYDPETMKFVRRVATGIGVNYSEIPEPSTWVLTGMGLLCAAFKGYRARNRD